MLRSRNGHPRLGKMCGFSTPHGMRSSTGVLDSPTGRYYLYLIVTQPSRGNTWRRSRNLSSFTFDAHSSVDSLNLSRNGKHAAWSMAGVTSVKFHLTSVRYLTSEANLRRCLPSRTARLRLFSSTFLAERQMLEESMRVVHTQSMYVPAPGLDISRWNRGRREEVTPRPIHPLSAGQRTPKEAPPTIGRSNGIRNGVDEFL
ncbi:hypothetical protein BDM02DRAFT_3106476, partial [Thelephora ganbajun]